MAEWYIVHVHLGKEDKVAGIINRKLLAHLYRPFIPQKEIFFRRAGITKIERRICFPGYVFIESQTTAKEFLDTAQRLIASIKEVYSMLSYDGKDDIALTETDMGLLRFLLGDGDCIKVSRGIMVDGVLKVDSGALVGKEETIVKINRSKQIAEIEINLMGEKKHITVGLEII